MYIIINKMSFIDAIEEGNLEIVKWFIKMDHDVNEKNEPSSYTPLRLAWRMGHIDIVKELINNGAIVYLKDFDITYGMYIGFCKGIRPSLHNKDATEGHFLEIMSILLDKIKDDDKRHIKWVKQLFEHKRQLIDDVIQKIP